MSKNGHAIFCLLFKMEQCAFLCAVCNDELILAKKKNGPFIHVVLFKLLKTRFSIFFVKLNANHFTRKLANYIVEFYCHGFFS